MSRYTDPPEFADSFDAGYFMLNIGEALPTWERLVNVWNKTSPPPSFEVYVQACRDFAREYPHMTYKDVARSIYNGVWPTDA